MLRAGILVCLTLTVPLLLASGCGDDDKTKRAMDPGDGGSASSGGETGAPGASGSSAEPGAAGAGGDATQPAGGGTGGTGDTNGGAPGAFGGADASSAGAGGSSSNAFVSACAYPNGGDCDELSGTSTEAAEFENQCLFNERTPLDACPTANVAGLCTSPEGDATLRSFHYAPIDSEELDAIEQNCLERPGEWTVP